jgi:hypothetical protein
MDTRLILECGGRRHPVSLTDRFAPRTAAALRAWLPAEITLHCSKIAGAHIYWPTPVLELLEEGADIHSLRAGAFLYYPDRQYMEITYAALQAETATVSLLGMFEGDLGWLRDFAETYRREQGRRPLTARLFLEGASAPVPSAAAPSTVATGPLERLRAARRAAWRAEPDELRAFRHRDGLNIPLGPVVTAEGAFRHLQELLWRVWRNAHGRPDPVRRAIAAEALELALARVVGYCHLHEAGDTLQAGLDALRGDADSPLDDILGEIVLYCGRMSAWLDLVIPWWEANEITRRNVAASEGTKP